MVDLKLANVSKKYKVRQEVPSNGGRNTLTRKLKALWPRYTDFWSVRDLNFEVQSGEALGIIGHNGAGKSTILKLLAGITTPTIGEININGRLSALIEVGSGFHPELTGRENVYLSGSILGMTRREISKKLDSIFEFAGVRPFIDTPVKRYSSGMYVRLGFSIAAHLEPDILLLDEVLAVGDTAFQAKCIKRVSEMKAAGTTIVFISHDLGAVESLCDRVLLMQRGRLIADGTAREVIKNYERLAGDISLSSAPSTHQSGEVGRRAAEIASIVLIGPRAEHSTTFHTGETLIVRIEVNVQDYIADAVMEVFFYTPEGVLTCEFTTEFGEEKLALSPGRAAVEFLCRELQLQPGLYSLDITIKHRDAAFGDDIDGKARCASLRVDPGRLVRGEFYAQHEWRVVEENTIEASSAKEAGEIPV